jgi:hypothetical protein
MYVTIFKIVQPFLQRFVINRAFEYTADYLNQRRELRLHPNEESLPAVEAALEKPVPVHSGPYSTKDVVWFTLAGMLLGSALGVILSYLRQPED